jgi:dihydrofolate reductase
VAPSLDAALALADDLPGDVVIAGGALVYDEAMRVADEQVLTAVHLTPEGDTFYPDFDPAEWVEQRRETYPDRDVVWLTRAG